MQPYVLTKIPLCIDMNKELKYLLNNVSLRNKSLNRESRDDWDSQENTSSFKI